MITAAVAPVIASSNHEAAWATVFALLAVFAICAVLYQHERRADRQAARIDTHDEQLAELAYQMPALLDWLGVEIPAPVEDDSPEAMAASEDVGDDRAEAGEITNTQVSNDVNPDAATDEIPIAPATVPDGMPLAVQTALIEQRPSPVPREQEWVERTVNIGGTLQTYRIPAKREEAL